ncbi:hypothetical protein [Rhodococcoides yunnanense]|uniref:hypothetical protein n=1 Tax=Rhodococcoides yunnanense TaxID=278209 RepID=UPI0011149B46|nr:hypothetical protein [Rhodococcus yunnanensis]
MTVASSKNGPIRETPEYRDAQSDPRFISWLKMQDAAIELEFIVSDVPELKPHLYTREGIVIAESAALERFPGWREAFNSDNLTLAMRFVYFIGETIRRHTGGQWVALPQLPPKSGAIQAIDAPFRSGFYVPTELLQVALAQRTGDKIVRVFDHALRAEQEWVDAGRPART